MMRKAVLAALLLLLFPLWIEPAAAGRNAADVAVYQNGDLCPTFTVRAATQFTLVGSGFRTWTPAKICLTGQYPCLSVNVDTSGSFEQVEYLYYPGTYLLHVYQSKNRNRGGLDLAYSGELTVVQ
ncbi:MAG TPA: hypothetical protein VNL37_05415 [Candidatus Polarisedimenticolia bacterium]|nr:hypothetical protein [Candidatus Polarisedimenticolia bacterium]